MAWAGLALCVVLIGALLINTFATNRLLAEQQQQARELRQQAVHFCRAEAQIRAKITEIEVEIRSYVYVPPSPICAGVPH